MLPTQSLAFLLLLLLAATRSIEAFRSVLPVGAPSQMRLSTDLSAWTILPTAAAPFSTWYNEYNPTARRTVYDE